MNKLVMFCVAAMLATPAAATTLKITITNDRPENGFALTPIYTAFHDGSFDTYNPGESADGFGGLEELAEVGDFTVARDRRILETVNSRGGLLSGFTPDNMRRPLFGGESDSFTIDITDTDNQRFFSFLSMIVPTNDLFIGNGNPMAFALFDEDGNYNGDRTISVLGTAIRDAGTEVNDRDFGVAFAADQDGAAGTPEGGVVTDGFDELAQFVGLRTIPGFFVTDDGINGTAREFALATITVSEVPLPAGGVLLLSALGLAGFAGRRRKKAD